MVSATSVLECFDAVCWVTGKVSGPSEISATYPPKFYSRASGVRQSRWYRLSQVHWKNAVKTEMVVYVFDLLR